MQILVIHEGLGNERNIRYSWSSSFYCFLTRTSTGYLFMFESTCSCPRPWGKKLTVPQNLAFYIRTHERALANSLSSQRQSRHHAPTSASIAGPGSVASADTRSSQTSTSNSLLAALSLSRSTSAHKTPKLFLTPNQLYYLLTRFEELGVSTGPLNVRLENIHADSGRSNYVSFLSQAQRPNVRSSDADSLHSVSSTRSIVSNMSSMLANLNFTGKSAAKIERQQAMARDDLRYLYSSFTKIPHVKLSVDQRLRHIAGFEEFPFDTAVPIHAFKNLTWFELSEIDFRSVYGWDQLADQLRTLVINRASLDDLELLTTIVLDDMDRRRRRSTRSTCATPAALRGADGSQRHIDIGTTSSPRGRALENRLTSSPKQSGNPGPYIVPRSRGKSESPHRRSPGPNESMLAQSKQPDKNRRSSGSSDSTPPPRTPRQGSSSTLLLHLTLPSQKWRFLRNLSVADNGLTSISFSSLQPFSQTLQILNLSSNLFSEIPEPLSLLEALQSLDMSNCMVESLRSLSRCTLPAITQLSLRANRVSSMAGIESLKSLQRLDVRENRITDPAEFARLTGMPDIHDVLIKRNPFIKTHAGHRVTIFNLFRTTPGYTEDITINSTGPGYSERRHLADRAPEIVHVPVVKAPFDDDDTNMLRVDGARDLKPQVPEVERIVEPGGPLTPEPHSQMNHRRKGPRRRIIDLATPGPPQTPASNASRHSDSVFMTAKEQPDQESRIPTGTGNAHDETPTAKKPNEARAMHVLPIDLAPQPDSPGEAYDLLTSNGAPVKGLSVSNDVYKQKIEALKRDHSTNWSNESGPPQLEPTDLYAALNTPRDRPLPIGERA